MFSISQHNKNILCSNEVYDEIIKDRRNHDIYLLNIDKELINLKGKTVEKLGLIGKEKAIACEVICSITQWKK